MKLSIKKRIISFGLLISLSIPFAINSLHFVLFKHHIHNLNFTKDVKLEAKVQSHLICQWDFAIEELTDAQILIETPFIHQSNKLIVNDKNIIVLKDEYFLLRAPPIS